MCTDQRGIPEKVPSAVLVLLLVLASFEPSGCGFEMPERPRTIRSTVSFETDSAAKEAKAGATTDNGAGPGVGG
jgi:hypothetical protein